MRWACSFRAVRGRRILSGLSPLQFIGFGFRQQPVQFRCRCSTHASSLSKDIRLGDMIPVLQQLAQECPGWDYDWPFE
jgi:hypothetical protein